MWVLWAASGPSDPSSGRAAASEARLSDQELIRRVASGDAETLGVVYDRHARQIFSLVLRIVEDQAEAEDVVQEVFSQAWSQASRYDAARGTVAAWLATIARSRAIDRLRARRAQPDSHQLVAEHSILDLPDPGAGQEVAVLTDEQVRELRAAMTRLPLLQRVAIELAYYEGLTQTEIAQRLEQPLGTVKTRIRLGLLKLREALQGSRP